MPFKSREIYNKYRKKEYQKNIQRRISHRFRVDLSAFISGRYKSPDLPERVGLDSFKRLHDHLMGTIPFGYSIEDYGPNGLTVDHIVPCNDFDLTIKEERDKCFHYTNLRLVPAAFNRSKFCNSLTYEEWLSKKADK